MFCIITVLPVRGGETISARWPLPSGVIRSMTRVVRSFARRIVELEVELLVGIKRRQIVEIDAMAQLVGFVEIDLVDLEQREIALAVLGRADLAFDGVAGAQPEAAHLARADIDIVGTGKIIGFRRAQEAEPVLQHFEHAVAGYRQVVLSELLQNREHHVLLAQRGRVLDFKLFGERQQLGRGFAFQFLEVHGALCRDGDRTRLSGALLRRDRRLKGQARDGEDWQEKASARRPFPLANANKRVKPDIKIPPTDEKIDNTSKRLDHHEDNDRDQSDRRQFVDHAKKTRRAPVAVLGKRAAPTGEPTMIGSQTGD